MLTATATPTPSWGDVYSDLRKSVVRLAAPTGAGTAWVYEPGWLLTAEHVVRGMSAVDIRYLDEDNNSNLVTGYVRGTDRYRDLAAIVVDIDLPGLPVASGVFTRQTAKPVMSLGYSSNPPTGFPNVRVGVVTTAYSLDEGELAAFETDATFDPGDSGGPVVGLDGRVMGMSQASRVTAGPNYYRVQGQQRALSISEVVEVWDRLKRGDILNASSTTYWWHRE